MAKEEKPLEQQHPFAGAASKFTRPRGMGAEVFDPRNLEKARQAEVARQKAKAQERK